MLTLLLGLAGFSSLHASDAQKPNIIYILADDLGYGDVGALNPACKIRTPSMDLLARQGMKFTDAHSGSAVCTPTRYGVLTGRYAWRTRLQSGVCWGYSLPLIARERMTVASMLKKNGYRTACVGKWHLGLEWTRKDPSILPNDSSNLKWDNFDFSKPIVSGPNQLGFDYFFGISASLDMHPHVYIENDRVTSVPTKIIKGNGGKAFWREGPIGDDFKHVEVLDKLTEKAVDFIGDQAPGEPFFLYFPLTAPHKPIIPSEKFLNRSGLNEWGDFVMQVDETVGAVMQAVEKKGLTDRTLIIVTSDNGATPGADFKTLAAKGHDPSGPLRGHKADLFEGGHRVAFLAQWPGTIPPGTRCDQTICHTDLLATAAEIVDCDLPDQAGEDSVSILPLMKQPDHGPVREATVHHSINGSFSIRRGKWKLSFCPGSGGWSQPRPAEARKKKLPSLQLYDLEGDLAEEDNLQGEYVQLVDEMTGLLRSYIDKGRSTPGARQKNDRDVNFQSK
ncbi:MAG: arylsulfatase [Planctomycetota bacterium]|nr:arylsulfatase [Planctomycetota bacterium]